MVAYENNHRVAFLEEAPTHLLFGREFIDLSRIPVNKGIKSRLWWTKHSDLYEIVHPNLDLIFLCLLTGGSGMRERSIARNFEVTIITCSYMFSLKVLRVLGVA